MLRLARTVADSAMVQSTWHSRLMSQAMRLCSTWTDPFKDALPAKTLTLFAESCQTALVTHARRSRLISMLGDGAETVVPSTSMTVTSALATSVSIRRTLACSVSRVWNAAVAATAGAVDAKDTPTPRKNCILLSRILASALNHFMLFQVKIRVRTNRAPVETSCVTSRLLTLYPNRQ